MYVVLKTGHQRRFRLRWRFAFHGRSDVVGPWDDNGGPLDTATRVPKHGLAWAIVEGEDVRTFDVIELLRVGGADYESAEWDVHVSGVYAASVGAPVRPVIHAYSVLTPRERLTVYVDGTTEAFPRYIPERVSLWR